jgi:hypothetical protein
MDIKVKKNLLLAILFSFAFMFFLLMRVDWQQFLLIAGRLDVKDLTIACSVFIFGNFIRAVRFNKLDHTDKKLIHWWNVNSFYNLITATLPGGAGEAATAYVLKRFSMLDLLGAFRILFLSRLLDLFAISVIFFFAAVQMSNLTPYREAAIFLAGILFLISLIALIPASEQFVMKLLQKLTGQRALIKRMCEKLSELIKISEEQRTNKSFRITLFQSVLMIIGAVMSTHYVLHSFGIDFTVVQSIYCFGIYAVFQIVPVQGIAGIGTQAAWWTLALKTAGYNAPDVFALGILLHGTFYVFIVILSLSALLIWLVSRKSDLNNIDLPQQLHFRFNIRHLI